MRCLNIFANALIKTSHMVKDFSSIIELKSIREQKSRLSEREKELGEPILTDLSLLNKLYEWFKEISSNKTKKRNERILQRKKFIFVVLFLYSPSTLAGGKMKKGLREKLGETLGIHGKSSISDNLNNLVFSYQLYKYFRQDIDRILSEIIYRLGSIHDNP